VVCRMTMIQGKASDESYIPIVSECCVRLRKLCSVTSPASGLTEAVSVVVVVTVLSGALASRGDPKARACTHKYQRSRCPLPGDNRTWQSYVESVENDLGCVKTRCM
jgi:hypothetical protein